MIGDILQPTHLLLILVVALVVLGPKRLPEVGRSLGRGLRDFRTALSGDDRPYHAEVPPPQTVTAQTAAPPAAPTYEPIGPEPTVPEPLVHEPSEAAPAAAEPPHEAVTAGTPAAAHAVDRSS